MAKTSRDRRRERRKDPTRRKILVILWHVKTMQRMGGRIFYESMYENALRDGIPIFYVT